MVVPPVDMDMTGAAVPMGSSPLDGTLPSADVSLPSADITLPSGEVCFCPCTRATLPDSPLSVFNWSRHHAAVALTPIMHVASRTKFVLECVCSPLTLPVETKAETGFHIMRGLCRWMHRFRPPVRLRPQRPRTSPHRTCLDRQAPRRRPSAWMRAYRPSAQPPRRRRRATAGMPRSRPARANSAASSGGSARARLTPTPLRGCRECLPRLVVLPPASQVRICPFPRTPRLCQPRYSDTVVAVLDITVGRTVAVVSSCARTIQHWSRTRHG